MNREGCGSAENCRGREKSASKSVLGRGETRVAASNANQFLGKSICFDKSLETRKCAIPLARDAAEIILHLLHWLRIERKQAFAAGARAVNDACALKHAKVLGDGLTSEARTGRQLRNGLRRSGAETRNKRETRLVAECGEKLGVRGAFVARASILSGVRAFPRHTSRHSASAASSRRRCRGMHRRASRPGCFRIPTQ